MQKLWGYKDATQIVIRLEDGRELETLRTLIERESTSTNVKTWEELSAGMASMIATFGIITDLTSFISVLVAAIAISLITRP